MDITFITILFGVALMTTAAVLEYCRKELRQARAERVDLAERLDLLGEVQEMMADDLDTMESRLDAVVKEFAFRKKET